MLSTIRFAILFLASSLLTFQISADDDAAGDVKYPYCIVEVENLAERSLADAIATFNSDSKHSPRGRIQRPINAPETLLAIEKSIALKEVPQATKELLRQIVASKMLPTNAYFRRFTRFDDGQQMNEVWWVRLVVVAVAGAPPTYSVPVRSTQIFSRPYTQGERQQNATGQLSLINRFVSYYEAPPKQVAPTPLDADAVQRLIAKFNDAKAEDIAAAKGLLCLEGASGPTVQFASKELRQLKQAKVHSVNVRPVELEGKLIHFTGFRLLEPNLPVVGFLEINYAPSDKTGELKKLSLEIGFSGSELMIVNYREAGNVGLPKLGNPMSWTGNIEPLADGSYYATDVITNPGELVSAHLANEEIRLLKP